MLNLSTVLAGCSLTDAVEAASLREEIARASGIAEQHNQTVAEIDRALRRTDSLRKVSSDSLGSNWFG